MVSRFKFHLLMKLFSLAGLKVEKHLDQDYFIREVMEIFFIFAQVMKYICLLYTSDAADE